MNVSAPSASLSPVKATHRVAVPSNSGRAQAAGPSPGWAGAHTRNIGQRRSRHPIMLFAVRSTHRSYAWRALGKRIAPAAAQNISNACHVAMKRSRWTHCSSGRERITAYPSSRASRYLGNASSPRRPDRAPYVVHPVAKGTVVEVNGTRLSTPEQHIGAYAYIGMDQPKHVPCLTELVHHLPRVAGHSLKRLAI